MEEKNENNSNSISNNYSKDNIYNKINSSSTISNKYYSNKKNPREMTVEELEEYIQKNRDKMNKYKNSDSHSLNKSFTSHYNFGMPEKIDKIDKIIINNYEKISPLSYKLSINKEKNKDKKSEVINESNFNLTQMERKKDKYFSMKDKDKNNQSFADNDENHKSKKLNNIFALPALETGKIKNSKKANNQVLHLKEMWNVFKNKKLKSINVSP